MADVDGFLELLLYIRDSGGVGTDRPPIKAIRIGQPILSLVVDEVRSSDIATTSRDVM
jgi:hypothetical protein